LARLASIWARRCWAEGITDLRLIFAYDIQFMPIKSVGKFQIGPSTK
jgi:hypothetical protein